MGVDMKRLKSFARGAGAPDLPPYEPSQAFPMGMDAFSTPMDVSLDNPDNLEPEAQVHRLKEPQTAYMELEGGWGAGGCGGCKYLMQKDSFCVKANVMSHVSADKGICRFFEPVDGGMVEPEDWEAITEIADAAGVESEEEDESDAEGGEDEDDDEADEEDE
jgi:hypothetical protein